MRRYESNFLAAELNNWPLASQPMAAPPLESFRRPCNIQLHEQRFELYLYRHKVCICACLHDVRRYQCKILLFFITQLSRQNLALAQYLLEREVVDVLRDFPSSSLPLPRLLSLLRALQPRYYSIASSPQKVIIMCGIGCYLSEAAMSVMLHKGPVWSLLHFK